MRKFKEEPASTPTTQMWVIWDEGFRRPAVTEYSVLEEADSGIHVKIRGYRKWIPLTSRYKKLYKNRDAMLSAYKRMLERDHQYAVDRLEALAEDLNASDLGIRVNVEPKEKMAPR